MSDTLTKNIPLNGAGGASALYGKVANVGNFSSSYIAVGGGGGGTSHGGGGGGTSHGGGGGHYIHYPIGARSISSTLSDTALTVNSAGVSITKPLVVNGRDVMQELDELRDSVLLLTRHVDMEAKYPKLKELKDAYQAQLEKYKTFDALKESK